MHRALLPAAALAVLALGATACNKDGASVAPTGAASPSAPAAPVEQPAESPAASPDAAPSASPSAASPTPTAPPAPAYDVKAVQRQLTALHYYAGAIDGQPGPVMASAVMAFQKVQGLGADGVIGKATLAALKAPRIPALRSATPADHVEVDLSKQVLYVASGGSIVRILPVSSGNGASYSLDGHLARALSPVGWYRIQRRIIGPHEAPLGVLYDPQFFYQGWAIHGSDSVPAYPASHGCIRVPRWDAKYLLTAMHLGTDVYLYGGSYTFTAGSSAPGTDAPAGDTPSGSTGSTSPTPSPRASSPSPSASPSPSPTASPTTSPTTSPSP